MKAKENPETGVWLDSLRRRLGAAAAWVGRRQGDRLRLEAAAGLSGAIFERGELPLRGTFDRTVLEFRRPLVVADAREDRRFSGVSLCRDLGYRFYAGIPLAPGPAVASRTLALLDTSPREVTSAHIRFLALLGEAFLSPKAKRALSEPGLDAFAEGFFMDLIQAELDCGLETNLIVLHLGSLEETRASRGEAAARAIMARLVKLLRSEFAPGDCLGRLGANEAALLWPGKLSQAQEKAGRLLRLVRGQPRLAASVGVASSLRLGGDAEALRRLAREAAFEARATGTREVLVKTARGLEAMPAPAPVASPPSSTSKSLEARYQRFVLLNRMSLELFSEKPFVEAMSSACGLILALMGAKYVAIYYRDEFGLLYCAYRHAEPPFPSSEAHYAESDILARSLKERRILSAAGEGLGWMATPLLRFRKPGASEDGAIIVGYPEAQEASIEREETLLEISRLLRNARLTQKNLQQQKTMAAVAEQSADAIFITDLETRVISWNKSAEELFGYAPEEIVGKSGTLLWPKDKAEEFKQTDEEALRRGSLKNFETVRQRKDGSLVPVEGTLTVLKDETGAPYGLVRVFRDITKRKEMDRIKTEFVSLVSHELRTPLTAIRGFAETIFDFWDELTVEQRRHYLGIILEESKRLGNLVTNFLDISRLESGGVELHPQSLDLASLARRIEILFHDHPAKARFETRLAPGAETVWGDEDQVYRVLVNLCGNALKYSPPGGAITLASRKDGGAVEISVADQGPGIPAQHRHRIFEKFYRIADAVSRKTPGTGLGLAISRSIVEAHGGRIWLESEPGQGTTFRFTLPDQGRCN